GERAQVRLVRGVRRPHGRARVRSTGTPHPGPATSAQPFLPAHGTSVPGATEVSLKLARRTPVWRGPDRGTGRARTRCGQHGHWCEDGSRTGRGDPPPTERTDRRTRVADSGAGSGESFDVVILGAGSGGYACALRA